jgi:hypothetical protein
MNAHSKAILLGLPLLAGCLDDSASTLLSPAAPATTLAPAPAHLVSVDLASGSHQIWPYTGTDFHARPQDPINLIFAGHADARNVRNALLSLDGNRNVPPFTSSAEGMLLAGIANGCRWTDAFGDVQTTYSLEGGWAGSVLQLECGTYNTFRYHLRLFPAGMLTLGNVHAEVIIPGTQGHEVLTWEAAEKFVMMELMRGDLLAAPPVESAIVNEVGSFKGIMPVIYNGLPDGHPLRMLAGGPLEGDVTKPVPLGTDGRATILTLVTAPAAPGTSNAFVIDFGQFIPKPFCAPSGEWVRVDGPVHVTHTVTVSPSGTATSKGVAKGSLTVRSFDIATGAVGPAIPAEVEQEIETEVGRSRHRARSKSEQRLLLERGESESFALDLRVGSGETYFAASQSCAPAK